MHECAILPQNIELFRQEVELTVTNGDDVLFHRTILHELLWNNLHSFRHFLHDLWQRDIHNKSSLESSRVNGGPQNLQLLL